MTNSDRPLPSYLDIAINDYEPTVKAKIYEIVAKSGIPHDDPYIAIFLSNAQVAATIATGPTLIREALNKGFEVGIQKFARSLSASMSELKGKDFETTVDTLAADKLAVDKKSAPQSQPFWGLSSIAFIGAGMLAIGLTAGIVSGLAIANALSANHSSPQAAKDLDWLASDEGKLARNLLDWNRDNLKACQQNQQNLKEALIVMNGKYVTKGLCALWILPDSQRVYEDRR
jgi:hypothetical protein